MQLHRSIASCALLLTMSGCVTMREWRERRGNNVVLQTHDASCGAAGLATLASALTGQRISEPAVLDCLKKTMPEDEYAQQLDKGFSMFSLREAASVLGLPLEGVKVKPASLAELEVPYLLLLTSSQEGHWVVICERRGNFALVKDPAYGNRIFTYGTLAARTKGFALRPVAHD